MSVLSGPGKTLLTLAGALTMICSGAFGQGTAAAEGSTPNITAFTHEMTLPFTNIGASGNVNIPANVVQSIQGGALEIRHSVEYKPSTQMLRVRHFLVAPRAPNPTPAGAQAALVDDYWVSVNSVMQYPSTGSIVMLGTIDQMNSDSPFGLRAGSPFIYSFGYEAGTPAKLNTVSMLIPGKLAAYGQTSSGTLTIGPAPGGNGGAKGPVADAGPDITTAQSELLLDATRSSHPDNDTLTYHWRVVRGVALILGADTARPRVQLSGNFGEYIFELTVTDSKKNTATDTVRVLYSGRF